MSYPLPDRVTVNGYLLAGHFQEKFEDNMALMEKVHGLADGLKAAHAYLSEKAPFKGKGNLLAKVHLPMGQRSSRVHIVVRQVNEEGGTGYKMRMDFNPRKLGVAGCKQLQENLQQAAMGAFHFGRFLADANLTRLDVAMDYTDVRPADLIVTTKKEGQRVHYLGNDGALETVQVHRPSTTPGVGTLSVKVYDRNRERRARGKPVPYPGRQVTRLEIVKKRFPKGSGLADLPAMKNPLAHVRLSYAPQVGGEIVTDSWSKYVAARLGVGHDAAVRSLRIQPIFWKSFSVRYQKHPSNLLAGDLWIGWDKGLSASGISYLVALALSGKSATS